MKNPFKILSWIFVSISFLVLASCGSANKAKRISNYQEKAYKKLKSELPEATVSIVNDSIKVLFPNHLLFKTGSADLNEKVSPTFERFSKVLNKYDKTNILINGYTDNTGTYEINKELSQKRSETAKTRLINAGVGDNRLFAWGHGDSNPIMPNTTEAGREKNRRVEFIVVYHVD